MSQPPARRLGNRPGLTGLRAVAIAIVVARHAGEVSSPAVTAFAFGFAGVDIFFVLSGFLITSLLVGEWSRTGRISLPQFYVRRALRLLPALFAFLLVLLAFAPFQAAGSRRSLVEAVGLSAAFLGNIAKTLNWTFPLAHMWSLGMEEQFYLLWPVTLLVLLRLRAARAVVMGVVVAGAIAVLTSRVVLEAAGSISAFTLFYSPLHSDGLLVGCALGLAYAWGWVPKPETLRRFLGPAVLIAAALFLLVSIRGTPYVPWGMTVGLGGIAVASAVLVYAAIDERPVLPLRFLIWRPVTFLGEISYALYLWHFPVLYLWPTNTLSVPGRVAVSLACASVSYHLVEKPFLRRKPPHTPDPAERDAALGPIVLGPSAHAVADTRGRQLR
jgi:peptidoglycan/LPS O-acetylase OafA/YrhL